MAYLTNITLENIDDLDQLRELPHLSLDSIIIGTEFDINSISVPYKFNPENNFIDKINNLLDIINNLLKKNGLLFIYGLPKDLIYYGMCLNNIQPFNFKYWIAIDLENTAKKNNLKNNHVGLLMYQKGTGSFHLNTSEVRIPYQGCAYCYKNIKDWGGKKHLMNINGTAVPDVWKDFYKVIATKPDPSKEDINLNFLNFNAKLTIKDNTIPDKVFNRIYDLIDKEDHSILKIQFRSISENNASLESVNSKEEITTNLVENLFNKAIVGNSIEIMEELLEKYPDGCFDLVFADPPYNLSKNYNKIDDSLSEHEYIEWCDRWLELCAKLLKPSGSLFVLNIPKWSIYHASTLNKFLYMQNWIVWDALSNPSGKIMPAHYSLLYYTKNPKDYTFNNPNEIQSLKFCIRNKCIKDRLKDNVIETVELNDIWSDIHRIKHKKDRDNHPCQLPINLLERIISMASNENDLVFDPFCGAGTTAIASKKLNRNFFTIDLSKEYVDITIKNLEYLDENGNIERDISSKKKKNAGLSKKQVELKVQELTSKLNRKPSEEEFLEYSKFKREDILELYKDIKIPLKTARFNLINSKSIKEDKTI